MIYRGRVIILTSSTLTRASIPKKRVKKMNESVSFQNAIEEQDLLFDLIKKRRIEARRKEITENAAQTLAAFKSDTAKSGNFKQLKADLLREEE